MYITDCILKNLTVSSGPQYFKYCIFILFLLPDRQVLLPLLCTLFETIYVAYTVKTLKEKHSPIKIKTYLFSAYSLPDTLSLKRVCEFLQINQCTVVLLTQPRHLSQDSCWSRVSLSPALQECTCLYFSVLRRPSGVLCFPAVEHGYKRYNRT